MKNNTGLGLKGSMERCNESEVMDHKAWNNKNAWTRFFIFFVFFTRIVWFGLDLEERISAMLVKR